MDEYVDLDLLLISLKDMQESWEGLRGRQAFPKVNNGGERGEKTSSKNDRTVGEESPLNSSLKNLAVAGETGPQR